MGKKSETPIERLLRVAEGLPGLAEGTSYGAPALKVGKIMLVRVKDEDTFVLMCPLEEKALLMEAEPDIYFETDHYKGWPAVLARASKIGDDELAHRIELSWRARAGKRALAAYDQSK